MLSVALTFTFTCVVGELMVYLLRLLLCRTKQGIKNQFPFMVFKASDSLPKAMAKEEVSAVLYLENSGVPASQANS
jgi:hypothetical protein